MIEEIVGFSIDGRAATDLVPDLLELEVEEDIASADVFRARLAVTTRPDGSWTYLDDERFRVWKRLAVEAGYPGATDTLVDGYVTHVEVKLLAEGACYLEVSGMDASAVLDLEHKERAWPNKADHEIAQEIFRAHGLSSVVEDTVARPADSVATTLQSDTDMRFLRWLAARSGFECFVRGGVGYFRAPNLSEPPQSPLAIGVAEHASLVTLELAVDGTPVTHPEIRRIDPFEKREESASLTSSPWRALGRTSLAALRGSLPDARALLRRQSPATLQEMQGRARDAYGAADRFVKVTGEIDARAYGAVLRAKRLVTLGGAGETYSGHYYVTKVRHVFTADGYAQHFEARRNGLGLTGSESFRPTGRAAVAASVADFAFGDRVLPDRQTSTTVNGGS
jgi:phage protein D